MTTVPMDMPMRECGQDDTNYWNVFANFSY